MATVDELFEQAMKLPKADRLQLALRLRQSAIPDPPGEDVTPEEWDATWGEEIERRLAMVDRGEYDRTDWRTVLDEIRLKHRTGPTP